MSLESREYIFSSPHGSDQCLNYLKEYNTILPNRVQFKGMYLRGVSRIWGNKFRLLICPWFFGSNMRCFFGEVVPQENGCLIKGKFKVRWMLIVFPTLIISIFLEYLGSGHIRFPEFIYLFLFYLWFFVAVFTLHLKHDLFGMYKEEYALEFLKTAFDAELKENS